MSGVSGPVSSLQASSSSPRVIASANAWLASIKVGWIYFARYPLSPSVPRHTVTFDPVLYTLDLISPAPLLGHVGAWNLVGLGLWLAVALKALGWLIAIMVVAALTRALQRD